MLGCNMFAYCLNNPVNMTDESGCVASYNTMMTDAGGHGGAIITYNSDDGDNSATIVESMGKEELLQLAPHNTTVYEMKIKKMELTITNTHVVLRGIVRGLVTTLATWRIANPIIGFTVSTAIEIILPPPRSLPEGTYDCYVVTMTGKQWNSLADVYIPYTHTFYVVDAVIGNKQEWFLHRIRTNDVGRIN